MIGSMQGHLALEHILLAGNTITTNTTDRVRRKLCHLLLHGAQCPAHTRAHVFHALICSMRTGCYRTVFHQQ
jgi:hypothetical protein